MTGPRNRRAHDEGQLRREEIRSEWERLMQLQRFERVTAAQIQRSLTFKLSRTRIRAHMRAIRTEAVVAAAVDAAANRRLL